MKKQLNFYERAVLHKLLDMSDNGILSRSYHQITDEIGGITYQSIKNYLDRFVSYGIVKVIDKGSHRQTFMFNMATKQFANQSKDYNNAEQTII